MYSFEDLYDECRVSYKQPSQILQRKQIPLTRSNKVCHRTVEKLQIELPMQINEDINTWFWAEYSTDEKSYMQCTENNKKILIGILDIKS